MKLILVVEDEYGSAEVLQLLLEAEGFRVATASNGKAALNLLEGEAPSLILSDFMMPIMNGAELGEAVRRSAALCQIPFVFMSATDEGVVRQAFSNYDAFLKKPFDFESMLLLVQSLVSEGRPQQPRSEDVGESMSRLLKGIRLPPPG